MPTKEIRNPPLYTHRYSPSQKAMAAVFLLPNFNPRISVKNFCTPRIPNINSTTSSKNCRFPKPLRSTHRHDHTNDSPSSSSADESTQSKQFLAEVDSTEDKSMPMSPPVLKDVEERWRRRKERIRLEMAASSSSDELIRSKQVLAEDDDIEDINMPISPSVLKALEEGGIGWRTEISRVKRAASSSSDEFTQSKKVLAEDNGMDEISMPISPTGLKALEEGGVGRQTEIDTSKRATGYAATPNSTKTPAISSKKKDHKQKKKDLKQKRKDHKQISRDFQLGMPRLQKSGNLEIVMLLQLIQQFTGLNIVLRYRGQEPYIENLFDGFGPFLYLTLLRLVLRLRNLGGLKYERDKEEYTEKLFDLVLYKCAETLRIDVVNNSGAGKLASIPAKMNSMDRWYFTEEKRVMIVYKYTENLKIAADKKNNSRSDKSSVVPTVRAPKLLMSHAFKGSGFTPDGRIVRYEDGFIFPGKLEGHPEDASNHIQQFLDLIREGNIVILTKSRKDPNKAWCVIAPWTWILGFVLPDSIYNWICVLSLLGAFVGALQFNHADPGLEPILWEPLVIPSLLLSVVGAGAGARWIVASKYGVANLIRWPAVFPCLGLGTMGALTGYKGRLPNRSSFLNLSLANIFGSLTFSFLLAFMGYSVGSSDAFSGPVVDFHGYFLVPSDMFSYSSFFTFLVRKLSIATYSEEMGDLKFVMNPISLSGLLGLNLCAFQLLPLSRSDGSRILEATLGREAKGNISRIVLPLLTICFLLKNPLLGLAWWSYIGCSGQCDDLFQREEITEPPLYGKLLGLGLVLAAFASFVPVLW